MSQNLSEQYSISRFAGAGLLCLFVLLCATSSEVPAETIERITIERLPVFPDTTATPLAWPLRLANRLHRTTSERVIRNEILFSEGSAFDTLRLKESERLLRRRRIFESVDIKSAVSDSGRHVTIRTHDLWTLALILSFDKQADLTTATVGVEESNVLGSGNEIRWYQQLSTDQDGFLASIDIPRIGAGRSSASLFYTDMSDGESYSAFLGRRPETPFDRWGWRLSSFGIRGKQRFFVQGEESGASRFERASHSFSVGRYHGRKVRFGYGIGWAERKLEPKSDPVSYMWGVPPPPDFEPRRHGGPLLHASAMQRVFRESTNLDRYGTVEDLPVGWLLQVSLGPNIRHEDDPSRAFATQAALAAAAFPIRQVCTSFEAIGAAFVSHDRIASERMVYATGTIGWQPSPRILSVAQVSALAAADRPATSVAYLGTSTGLRGFPAREFEVRDYVMATFEQRFWSGIETLWTGIGADIFVNTALPSRSALSEAETWRTGVGFGLLFGVKKSLRPPLRIEIAWRTDKKADPTLTVSMQRSLQIIPSIFLPSPTFLFAEPAR